MNIIVHKYHLAIWCTSIIILTEQKKKPKNIRSTPIDLRTPILLSIILLTNMLIPSEKWWPECIYTVLWMKLKPNAPEFVQRNSLSSTELEAIHRCECEFIYNRNFISLVNCSYWLIFEFYSNLTATWWYWWEKFLNSPTKFNYISLM